ncbi:MAG: hypothetical protein ACRDI3_00825, partial [Actinomycetota bacterium]
LATAALSPPAAATGGRKSRTVSIEYTGATGYVHNGPVLYGNLQVGAPYELETRPGERYLSLVITDDAGTLVGVEVAYADKPDSAWYVCGATARPLQVTPDETFALRVMNAPCSGGQRSVPVRGTIEVTASNLP